MAGTNLTVFGSILSGFIPAGGIDEGEDVLRVSSHELFGIRGATAITGNVGAKDVRVIVHLTGFATEAALAAHVLAIRLLPLQPAGLVVVSGKRNISWSDCLLVRVEDSGKGALPNPADYGKWHQEITLRFVQLIP